MKLTPDQQKAVSLRGRHVLLSAGAGTGKTRTLVERVVELVARRSVPVSELLILTFTDKAAGEIKQRLSKRFQEENLFSARQELEAAYISTFHGFSARLLRNHPVEAGADPEFRVLENEEAEILKEEALDEAVSYLYENQVPAFALFREYGENGIREAILSVHHAAGQEGLNLTDYFSKWKKKREENLKAHRQMLSARAKESAEPVADKINISEWNDWVNKPAMTWAQIENFRAWLAACGRSPKLTPWKNFVRDEWLPFQTEQLVAEPMYFFEQAALRFESIYIQKKQNQNGLDFDDLQTGAVQMLRVSHPGAKIVAGALKRQFRYVFVDEFQDTSHLQMELVRFLMPQAEIFLVGDYKQSIYAFRGAEPRLFLETEEAFSKSEAALKIELTDNFRSDAGVLGFANHFFEKLWDEDGLPFSKLKASKPKQENADAVLKPELIAVESDEDGGAAEDRLREGGQIAARMLKLQAQGVSYGDMAVLFSAMTHSALYEYTLRRAGIPYVSVSGMSFYEQPEIRDLISLLECLQNPLADVPLASLLRSPFVGVNDETLFWLAEKAKTVDERLPLYDGLIRFRDIEEIEEAEKSKIDSFLTQFEIWRSRKDAGRLSDLIDDAVQKTGYAVWALAQTSGIRRYGHVRKFIQLARRQENRGRLSIHRFLALVRRLQFQEVRESDHHAAGEEIQAVKLMTIHAAKGLEFPYVFLADLGRRQNRQERGPVLALPNEGWSMKAKNPVTGKSEPVWSHEQIGKHLERQSRAEKKRLFYVAVTRAEKHLVLSGVHKPVKKEREGYADMASWMEWVMSEREAFECLPKEEVFTAGSLPAPACSAEMPSFQKWIADARQGLVSAVPEEKIPADAGRVIERVARVHQPEFSKVIDLPVSAYVLFAQDRERFWDTYGQGRSLPQAEQRDIWSQEPAARGEDAADFGTRMHRALEFLDWKKPESALEAKNMDALFAGVSEGQKQEAGKILSGFFATELFREMQASRKVCRELSFVLNARRGLIDGVIDVLFLNPDDTYTVLDYKTAEGDEEKSAKQGYDLQIKIYALAASKILGRPVSRAQIYFLKNNRAVTVSLDSFERIETEINDLQLELLDFVKGKWAHA